MSTEYHTGYCENCDADRKLERKVPNHILHFLITVVLGIFTYGIGSLVWLAVWYVISSKFSGWTCHVCGSTNDDPIFHHTEHNTKDKSQSKDTNEISKLSLSIKTIKSDLIIEKLKQSPKLVIGLLLFVAFILFLFTVDMSDDTKSTETKKKKENVVNATVNIQKSANVKENISVEKEIESELCYIYNIKRNSNIFSGSVSCEEGKLTIDFYDIDTKSIVETKTIMFKENKFRVKLDTLDNLDFKVKIKLTKKQIEKEKQKLKEKNEKSISSIKSYDQDKNTKENKSSECLVKNWKYSKYSQDYLVVDGTTTCKNGKIMLEIYDENNKKLGVETDNLESGVFSIFFKTTSNPSSVSLDYTISQK